MSRRSSNRRAPRGCGRTWSLCRESRCVCRTFQEKERGRPAPVSAGKTNLVLGAASGDGRPAWGTTCRNRRASRRASRRTACSRASFRTGPDPSHRGRIRRPTPRQARRRRQARARQQRLPRRCVARAQVDSSPVTRALGSEKRTNHGSPSSGSGTLSRRMARTRADGLRYLNASHTSRTRAL
jgi:hypothetical protein